MHLEEEVEGERERRKGRRGRWLSSQKGSQHRRGRWLLSQKQPFPPCSKAEFILTLISCFSYCSLGIYHKEI
jgi:hypothetical protein